MAPDRIEKNVEKNKTHITELSVFDNHFQIWSVALIKTLFAKYQRTDRKGFEHFKWGS